MPSTTITVLPVQQQKGSKGCELFAIASATELCSGQDPTRAFFKQCKMRLHLYNCLKAGKLSPFPQYTQEELLTLPKETIEHSTLLTAEKDVFCSCCLPDFFFDKHMVQYATPGITTNVWSSREKKRHPTKLECQCCMKKYQCAQLYAHSLHHDF